MAKSKECRFGLAWIGQCGKTAKGKYCEEHSKERCVVCKKQATHQCDAAGSLVCGAPLCENCVGYQDTEGSNKDFHGFIGTGVHSHKKAAPPEEQL